MFLKTLSHWQAGIIAFNEGRHWDAHHDWEYQWVKLPEPARTHIQALIQFSAVVHHWDRGRLAPARALCLSALEKWARVGAEPPSLIWPHRVEVPGLVPMFQRFLRALEEAEANPALERWREDVGALRAHLVSE